MPSRNNCTEKAEFTATILSALPPANDVPGGRPHALARACLQALANSNRADVQTRLIASANEYARNYSSNYELAKVAQASVNTMEDLIHPINHP